MAGRRLLPARKLPVLGCAFLLAAAAVLDAPTPPAGAGAGNIPHLQMTLASRQVTIGTSFTIGAQVLGVAVPLAPQRLQLQADPYPFRGRFRTIAEGLSSAAGTLRLTVGRLERNTRLRLLAPASGDLSATVQIYVNPAIESSSHIMGPGQTYLSVGLRHDPSGNSAAVPVRWYIAERGSGSYRLARVTASRELRRGLTYAEAVVASPWRRFRWQACLSPAWSAEMGVPGSIRSCPTGDVRLAGDDR